MKAFYAIHKGEAIVVFADNKEEAMDYIYLVGIDSGRNMIDLEEKDIEEIGSPRCGLVVFSGSIDAT